MYTQMVTDRCKPILRRWLDLFAYAGISVVLMSLSIDPLHRLVSEGVGSFFPAWPTTTIIIFLSLACVVVALCAVRLQLIGLRHPRYLLVYPPLWIAGFLGCCGLWGLWAWGVLGSQGPPLLFEDALHLVGVVAVALVVGLGLDAGYRLISPRLSRSTTAKDSTPSASGKWWSNDDPINRTEADRYGATRAAGRLAKQLEQGKSVALTGAFGSGKTSIQRLAEQQLDSKKYWDVTVSGWGLSDHDAPAHVLRLVIQKIACHVDATRLATVPRRYCDAIGAAHWTARAVLGALTGPRDPYDVLAEVDELLAALGVTLIISLEDLDRNTGLDDQNVAMRNAAALLDRLHRLKHLTFVLALDVRRVGSADLLRLCDYTEPLAPLPQSTVQKELLRFKSESLTLTDEQIDLAEVSSDVWMHWLGARLTNQEGELEIMPGELAAKPAAQAVMQLLETPRKLKRVLCQTAYAWETLRGEVDPMDLLVATTLKVAAPEAWEFMVGWIDEIRAITASLETDESREKEQAQARRDRLSARLTQHLQGALWDRDAIDAMFQHLFGTWLPVDQQGASGYGQRATSQSPTDYLRRIIRGAVDESPTDQAFCQALQAWSRKQRSDPTSGDASGFIVMLHDQPHAAWLLRYFQYMLPEHRTLPLAEQLIACSLKKFGHAAYFHSSEAHLVIGWIAADRRKEKVGSISTFLRQQLRMCVPVSLQLAYDLKTFWTTSNDQLRKRAGQLLNARCRKHLPNPDAWLKVLPPQRSPRDEKTEYILAHYFSVVVREVVTCDMDTEYILAHLMRWHEDNTPPDSWSWSVGPLLGAAEREPKRVVPRLRALLSKSTGEPPFVYSLREDFLDEWCPPDTDDRNRLLGLLADPVQTTDNNARLNQAICNEATALLAKL